MTETIEEQNNQTEEQQQSPPAWYLDENLPGIGSRPTWLQEKFKTVADLAKSHAEMEKRLGTVPEDYDFSKSNYLDPDYEPFSELRQLAKDKRVPKDVMDKMVESFDKYMNEFSVDYNEELQKLGENAKERVTVLDNWAKANLSKEAYRALTASINNAEAVKALEELRGRMMSQNPQVPTGNTGNVESSVTVDDLQMELSSNLEKYKTDIEYRKNFQKRLEVAAKNAPGYIDKIGS